MIKLKKFADNSSSSQQKNDRSFASAANNIILRNTAINQAPDHNDSFYGKNKTTAGANPEEVEDATKVPQDPIEDAELYMTPREDSAVMEEVNPEENSYKSNATSDEDEDYLVGI